MQTGSQVLFLELINEFSQVTRYKINTQKSLAFLYTNNEKSGREIKEVIPFTIATKRIKYPGINLPKETKDLYAENYEVVMKEIKDDTDGEVCHVLGLEDKICENSIYRFNATPIKLPVAFSQN